MTNTLKLDDNKVLFTAHIAGLQFAPGKTMYKSILPGQRLALILEPANKYDKYAVEIYLISGSFTQIKLGYIPGAYNRIVHTLIANGVNVSCHVEDVNVDVPVTKTPITIVLSLT